MTECELANTPYPVFVHALCKPGEDIRAALTPLDCHKVHMAIGVAGEAGELLDAIKKGAIYRKEYDRANIIEELGDLMFFQQGLMTAFGISPLEVIDANKQKLAKRYEKMAYSDQAAQQRKDKAPTPMPATWWAASVNDEEYGPDKHETPEAAALQCLADNEEVDTVYVQQFQPAPDFHTFFHEGHVSDLLEGIEDDVEAYRRDYDAPGSLETTVEQRNEVVADIQAVLKRWADKHKLQPDVWDTVTGSSRGFSRTDFTPEQVAGVYRTREEWAKAGVHYPPQS